MEGDDERTQVGLVILKSIFSILMARRVTDVSSVSNIFGNSPSVSASLTYNNCRNSNGSASSSKDTTMETESEPGCRLAFAPLSEMSEEYMKDAAREMELRKVQQQMAMYNHNQGGGME